MRAFSQDEILEAQEEIMSTAAEQLASHTEALKPVRKVEANNWPADRWVGTRGINPLNESERKLLEACEKDGVSFAEKKNRLLRLREDMQRLKPAKISS